MPASPPDDRARAWARRSLTLYAVAFALPVGHPSFPGAEAFAASFMQGVSGRPFFLMIWLANPLLWLSVWFGGRGRTGRAAATGVVATLAALTALRMVGDDLYVVSPLPWRAVAIRSGLFAWIGGIGGFSLATARLWWRERGEGHPIQVRVGWMMTAVALVALAIQVWRWAEPPQHPPIRCDRGGNPAISPNPVNLATSFTAGRGRGSIPRATEDSPCHPTRSDPGVSQS